MNKPSKSAQEARAAILAALTDEPQTAKQIASATGLTPVKVANNATKLAGMGKIAQIERGYGAGDCRVHRWLRREQPLPRSYQWRPLNLALIDYTPARAGALDYRRIPSLARGRI